MRTRKEIMAEWDKIRFAIAHGNTTSGPRDWFEGVLEDKDAEIDISVREQKEMRALLVSVVTEMANKHDTNEPPLKYTGPWVMLAAISDWLNEHPEEHATDPDPALSIEAARQRQHPGADYMVTCHKCGKRFSSDDKRDPFCVACLESGDGNFYASNMVTQP